MSDSEVTEPSWADAAAERLRAEPADGVWPADPVEIDAMAAAYPYIERAYQAVRTIAEEAAKIKVAQAAIDEHRKVIGHSRAVCARLGVDGDDVARTLLALSVPNQHGNAVTWWPEGHRVEGSNCSWAETFAKCAGDGYHAFRPDGFLGAGYEYVPYGWDDRGTLKARELAHVENGDPRLHDAGVRLGSLQVYAVSPIRVRDDVR